jgi:hypothetical protein
MNIPPHCQAIREDGPDGQVWPMALDLTGVACSVGAACSSGQKATRPVDGFFTFATNFAIEKGAQHEPNGQ